MHLVPLAPALSTVAGHLLLGGHGLQVLAPRIAATPHRRPLPLIRQHRGRQQSPARDSLCPLGLPCTVSRKAGGSTRTLTVETVPLQKPSFISDSCHRGVRPGLWALDLNLHVMLQGLGPGIPLSCSVICWG